MVVNRLLRCLAVAGVLLAAACQSAPGPTTPVPSALPAVSASGGPPVTVFVASNGWHSAIVVPRASLPSGVLPEARDLPEGAYLSFGWGDAAYFPARDPGFGLALDAAFTPTPAVLHLAALPDHPAAVFPADEVVTLEATAEGFAALIAYLDGTFAREGAARVAASGPGLHPFSLDGTFAREGAARVAASGPGLHPFSLFYPATGKFHLFNTCNTWTARGLGAAGWPVRTSGTVTAEELMVQVRPLAAAAN